MKKAPFLWVSLRLIFVIVFAIVSSNSVVLGRIGGGGEMAKEPIEYAQYVMLQQHGQHAVLHSPTTAIAVCVNSSIVIVGVSRKAVTEIASNMLVPLGSSVLTNKDERIVAAIVGNQADVYCAQRLVEEVVASHRAKHNTLITASLLSIYMADDVFERARVLSRPLAINCMFVDKGGIYKVDLSGNVFKCNACAIGRKSFEMNKWLHEKGGSFASSSDPNATAMEQCLDMVEACLEANLTSKDIDEEEESIKTKVVQQKKKPKLTFHLTMCTIDQQNTHEGPTHIKNRLLVLSNGREENPDERAPRSLYKAWASSRRFKTS